MLRCYILDDEQQAVDGLAAMIKKKFPGQLEVVGSTIHGTQAIDEIETLQPHIVFLDIEMPAMNGLEILKHFPQPEFQVIFTTAHEKYALQALKASATDYLVKPISPQDLHLAIQKCIGHLPTSAASKISEPLISRLVLPSAHELVVVNISDIIRIEGQDNYSHFYFLNRPKMIVAKTLKEYEEQLSACNFFRVHQSHLINLAHIESVQSFEGDYVLLKQGHKVEISRRKKPDFLQRLKQQ